MGGISREDLPARAGRRAQYASVAQMEAQWSSLPADDVRVRDAHCHEVVMGCVSLLMLQGNAPFPF